jgi:hypothetical protein
MEEDMPINGLLRYIARATGTWIDPPQGDTNPFGFTRADTVSPSRLMLRWADDFVALAGPLRVRVTVQAENQTVPLALVGAMVSDVAGRTVPATPEAGVRIDAPGGFGESLTASGLSRAFQGRTLGLQASTIYSYTLDIAAGHAWPFSLSEQLDGYWNRRLRGGALEQLGNNLGFRVIIEPGHAVPDCAPAMPATDLPCDFAVADRPDTARFFPAACEPCEGSVIGLPPTGSVSLVTPPAEGGCVRTRFFNGMFITREDLETEQRYHRLKSRLHNRAAGAGVVWGLGVGQQGGRVCVQPGYGVDCCGNDLALTTAYRVEIAALLADPAAAPLVRRKGPQRQHLRLAYVECPSDPRPVHGDPCSPESDRCEMSRIRESVRLRLVPPRDCGPAREKSPIGKFLDEVRALRAAYPLDPVPATNGATAAPFVLELEAAYLDDAGQTQLSTFVVRPTSRGEVEGLRGYFEGNRLQSLTVEVVPDGGWSFADGTMQGEAAAVAGSTVPGIANPAGSVRLALAQGLGGRVPPVVFSLSQASGVRPRELVFRITGWRAQRLFAAPEDPALGGDLRMTVTLSDNQVKLIELAQTPVAAHSLNLAPNPCAGEPCAARRAAEPAETFGWRAFDAMALAAADDPTPFLPWLHADPAHPDRAGDPKALALAALGGWLMRMLAREGEGTANAISTPRREIAQGIYRAAWLLLFGLPEKADPAALAGTLQRLLEGWCDALLWKGPECCGEPHGVVIGCAVVDGGTIQRIDPYGGRRYVVHYPLLAYWGAQFGIAPPDQTLVRFFSKLCCIVGLAAPAVDRPELPALVVPVGCGYFAAGEFPKINRELRDRAVIVETRTVGAPELIASALALMRTQRSDNETGNYTALVLGDVVAEGTVMLLVPAGDGERQRV